MGVKFAVNESFFNTWSTDMAYVMGYFYADGGLEDSPSIRGKYVRFSSTDHVQLKNVKALLGSEHSIVLRKNITSAKRNYLLRIGNERLYGSLERHGVRPNKSLSIQFPYVPDEQLRHFVRGYFDGDGCVHIERQSLKNGMLSIKRLHTSFTSGSSKFLLKLGELLYVHVGVQSKLYKNGTAFQLRYNTKSSVLLFKFMYPSSSPQTRLDRKITLFQSFFDERERWIDTEIQSILDHL